MDQGTGIHVTRDGGLLTLNSQKAEWAKSWVLDASVHELPLVCSSQRFGGNFDGQ